MPESDSATTNAPRLFWANGWLFSPSCSLNRHIIKLIYHRDCSPIVRWLFITLNETPSQCLFMWSGAHWKKQSGAAAGRNRLTWKVESQFYDLGLQCDVGVRKLFRRRSLSSAVCSCSPFSSCVRECATHSVQFSTRFYAHEMLFREQPASEKNIRLCAPLTLFSRSSNFYHAHFGWSDNRCALDFMKVGKLGETCQLTLEPSAERQSWKTCASVFIVVISNHGDQTVVSLLL